MCLRARVNPGNVAALRTSSYTGDGVQSMGAALPCPSMTPSFFLGVGTCWDAYTVSLPLHACGVPCPLLRQSSEELKGLLEVAFTKQKEALVAHWGQGVDEEAKINK